MAAHMLPTVTIKEKSVALVSELKLQTKGFGVSFVCWRQFLSYEWGTSGFSFPIICICS